MHQEFEIKMNVKNNVKSRTSHVEVTSWIHNKDLVLYQVLSEK